MRSKIVSAGEKTSGKERAKQLKAQREREKARESHLLPDDDSDPSPLDKQTTTIVSEAIEQSTNQIGEEKPSSSLPDGFFDNERDEIVAKGLNMVQEIQKREESATEVLQSFFEEVDNIAQDPAPLEAEVEDEETELAESALQLAYSAKIGNLLLRCDPKRKKDGHDLEDLEAAAHEAAEILGQDHDLNEDQQADGEAVIQSLVETALANKKRKISSRVYEPTDLMDWTSRAIR
jgi:hypothetical protein